MNNIYHTVRCSKCKNSSGYTQIYQESAEIGLKHLVAIGIMKKRGNKYRCTCGAEMEWKTRWIPTMSEKEKRKLDKGIILGHIEEL
jgi:hypothetical protein